MTEPDFPALRAKRNHELRKAMQRLADEMGFTPNEMCTSFDPNGCYCACATGGPCEHTWNGEPYESEDGAVWSATCSRCGVTALSHSVRIDP